MNKRKNIVSFTIIFMFVLIHVGKNSNFRGAKKYFITLKITWILMFGGLGLDPANAKDNSIVLRAHGFKPLVPARNLNNPKSNNPALGGAGRIGSVKTIFLDHKRMIDFGKLAESGIDTSGFPSHEKVTFDMGKDSVKQKLNYIGFDQGPKSKEEVIHIYNFEDIRDRTEVPFLMQAVLNGSEQAGCTDDNFFLNYE